MDSSDDREPAEDTAQERLDASRERLDRVAGAVDEAKAAAATARDEGADLLPPEEPDAGRAPDVVHPEDEQDSREPEAGAHTGD
jgi:hypothetical protein